MCCQNAGSEALAGQVGQAGSAVTSLASGNTLAMSANVLLQLSLERITRCVCV